MGRTIFIRVISSENDLHDTIRCIIEHNSTPLVRLGTYTDEDFQRIDPTRANALTMVLGDLPVDAFTSITMECKQRFNRGENIEPGGIFVRFDGKLWLEVRNYGGGACTTAWLHERYPAMGWIGTEGKPDGYIDAPAVSASCGSFRELVMAYRALI
jgi:hypothetical protein